MIKIRVYYIHHEVAGYMLLLQQHVVDGAMLLFGRQSAILTRAFC